MSERYWACETLGVSLHYSLYLVMGTADSSLAKTLVRAIAIRRWVSPEFCLVVAGQEEFHSELGSLARQQAVSEHLRFIDAIPTSLDRWICAVDALVCLSNSYETWAAIRKAQSALTSILFATAPHNPENTTPEAPEAWSWILRSDCTSPSESLADLMVRSVENTPERHSIRVHAKHLASPRSTRPVLRVGRVDMMETSNTVRKVG
jgi:hypothetical protein